MAKQIICPKCGYIFAKGAKQRDLTKHLKRKNPSENEFKRLSNITGDYEKNLIFREQQLGPALKRRVIAVYNAKVHTFHPDNGSDIRRMLESQRKNFENYLKKNLTNEANSNSHYVHLQNFF
nr:10096_t:CDS:2 [Entrophospora candida]